MSEPAALLEADDVRLLVEIGFSALSRGLLAPAETIFAGVEAARPGSEAAGIGRALARLHGGAVDEAVGILRALPPSDAARAFLGLAVSRTGDRAEARAILAEVAQSAPGTPPAAMAQDLLAALA
ncbi:hypothetical protein BHAOGJBA_4998 [Methylobacterium hispanicum]|jgi:thioredoxin-like negative regulator of GroEL|uniref:Tetratricopeptide repeat protein n=1 Tax=Methylobacterium hispanicum TaxID=270350 RepID=A0AAV4ZTX8_9HYPH|nr:MULTISPECIES: hypothetical protein [Methylobacterium]GJD91450.1 hypothetical protein BHAOGJBA_4998 [Methylobacterium hispanicum]